MKYQKGNAKKKTKEKENLEFQDLRLFPGENVPSEVSVCASLLENWCLKLQVLDDLSRPEVKVFLDDVCEFGGCL